jgi:hypothetical protein
MDRWKLARPRMSSRALLGCVQVLPQPIDEIRMHVRNAAILARIFL